MMQRRVFSGLSALLLCAACTSTPPPPTWQGSVVGASEQASEAWLSGQDKIEQVEFARARRELSRTGRADLVARLELRRCATRVASLVFEPCEAFDKLAADAGPGEQAYGRYLAGQATPADAALLPEAQRGVLAGGTVAVAAIKDPLSRLVAAGTLFRMDRSDPALIALAIDTASERGWNRPLLAWLMVQQRRAELAGDGAAAARIKRRIDLVTPPTTR